MSKTAAPSRLEAVRATLTAAGVPEPKGNGFHSFELTQGPLALSLWYQQAIDNCLSEVYTESWPTDETELGEGARFRDTSDEGQFGIFQVDGALALVCLRQGEVILSVAAATRDEFAAVGSEFHSRFPFTAPATDDLVPITFWSYGKYGPQSYTRRIAVAPWDEITENYSAAAGVQDELARLMQNFEPGQGGQLLLWQGPPGTGKTWALRALASEWREWAEFHYVTDPDAFFGQHADYMVEVLLKEAWSYDTPEGEDPTEKWRLLVLEDTGELLSSDAKEKSGQALSRLLNVVDGLIGQGLRVLVLVTTNDEIESFHPAVSRPGRCASAIEFGPLSADEVAARTGDDGAKSATLAEIYARYGNGEDALTSDAAPTLGGIVETTVADPQVLADVLADVPVPTPADERPARQPDAEVEIPEQQARASQAKWEGILLVEDKLTEDGRYIAPGATTWRDLPLSLMAMTVTPEQGGHGLAFLAGRIDKIWREGNLVMGAGVFNDDEDGNRVAQLVVDKMLTGNSVDLAVREFELAPRSDFDEDGRRIVREEDGEEGVDLFDLLLEGEPIAYIFTDCVIGMSTLCPFPAFADASISVTAAGALQWRAYRQSGMIVVAENLAFDEDEARDDKGRWTSDGRSQSPSDPFPNLKWDIAPAQPAEVENAADAYTSYAAQAEEHPELWGEEQENELARLANKLMDAYEKHGTEEMDRVAGLGSGHQPPPYPHSRGGAGEQASGALRAAVSIPETPPADWFADPELAEPTPLTISADGRVFGHAALWDTCHIGIPDVCTTAPHSATNYAYFLLGEVEVEDGGEPVSVGKITLGTGHAAKHLKRQATAEHYDNTGSAVADIAVGEDAHGIWFSGALRSGLSAERIRELRASVLSGDWRNVNGNLELVGLLAVNVPGFPVSRTPRALLAGAADGVRVLSLVAAGVNLERYRSELTRREETRLKALAARAGGIEALAELAAA